jgi:hypothetical protein
MEAWNGQSKEPEYVSSVANAKINAAKEANKKLEDKFSGELQDKYCFTDELDKLGQSKGKDSHIAVVHIDGNNMGERFRNAEKLQDLRKLCISAEDATVGSVRFVIKTIVEKAKKIQEALGRYDTGFERDENGKEILPIRPIIIGGDDITFVADGRLGIYFAKLFIESFEKQTVSDGLPLSACAGVAVTKTKYPFYRGYALSEELCKHAKSVRKEKNGNGSWIDFHLSYGGFSGGIEEIRKRHYKGVHGNLLMRPYRTGRVRDELSFDSLIENAGSLLWKTKEEGNFPLSKIKELRSVLTLGEEACQTFVKEAKARGRDINEKLFLNNKTPYFDMIELMEVYPDFELKAKGEAT